MSRSSRLANDSLLQLHLCSYELSSGYKPAPLDLSHIKLTPTQEAMVDKLAENAHNVWARDRIRQGWTYGIQQVSLRHCYCSHTSLHRFCMFEACKRSVIRGQSRA